MRKGFEVNGDYRLMDSSELVYILTNSAVMDKQGTGKGSGIW